MKSSSKKLPKYVEISSMDYAVVTATSDILYLKDKKLVGLDGLTIATDVTNINRKLFEYLSSDPDFIKIDDNYFIRKTAISQIYDERGSYKIFFKTDTLGVNYIKDKNVPNTFGVAINGNTSSNRFGIMATQTTYNAIKKGLLNEQ